MYIQFNNRTRTYIYQKVKTIFNFILFIHILQSFNTDTEIISNTNN